LNPPTDDPSTAPLRRGDAAPRHGRDRVDQPRLHEAGDEQGAPVVLLHRRGATAEVWVPTLALGSWTVRLLAPDLSELPGLPDGPDAAYVVDSLRRTERRALLVVAEGDAASLAVDMALARPEAVAGLVLLAPAEDTARALVEPLRRVTVPVWAATGERSDPGAASSSVEVPGARWLNLPGVGDEPVTEHPDLVIDLVHGAVAELAASPRPQDGRRYITWVSSDACVKPSLSR
jgi:pimeloyl-ACP methyl ester carboxylesterase